jgi:hypothetical protein
MLRHKRRANRTERKKPASPVGQTPIPHLFSSQIIVQIQSSLTRREYASTAYHALMVFEFKRHKRRTKRKAPLRDGNNAITGFFARFGISTSCRLPLAET